MRRTIWLTLLAAIAVTALTACMSDSNGNNNESARGERRAAALVALGNPAGDSYQLVINGITPAGKAIDVVSYSWGVARPVGGRATFEHLTIQKGLDETSPLLIRGAATGQRYASAVLKLYKAIGGRSPVNYATYDLTNAEVLSVQHAGGGGDTPMENVTLNYGQLRSTVAPIRADGSLGTPEFFGWDLAAGREIQP